MTHIMFWQDVIRALAKLHGGQSQMPALHTVFWGQVLPHAPQFLKLMLPSTSQPLLESLSQSRNEPLQDWMAHPPPTHFTCALGRCEQSVPQEPQFFASVAVFTSHPSARLALHSL